MTSMPITLSLFMIIVFPPPKVTTESSHGCKDYDEKPVKSAFDPAGYDKELVEALERDILQQNPNIKWWVTFLSNTVVQMSIAWFLGCRLWVPQMVS